VFHRVRSDSRNRLAKADSGLPHSVPFHPVPSRLLDGLLDRRLGVAGEDNL